MNKRFKWSEIIDILFTSLPWEEQTRQLRLAGVPESFIARAKPPANKDAKAAPSTRDCTCEKCHPLNTSEEWVWCL